MKHLILIVFFTLCFENSNAQFYIGLKSSDAKEAAIEKYSTKIDEVYTHNQLTSLQWVDETTKTTHIVFLDNDTVFRYCFIPKNELVNMYVEVYNTNFVVTSNHTWICYSKGRTINIYMAYIPELKSYTFYHQQSN